MAILRAFKAKHGDSLLLLTDDARVLIDGGPSGVYSQTLRDGLADLEIRVVGPTRDEVDDLRETWARELPTILAKESAASVASAAAALDTSVTNLASIVAIAEVGGKKALLTGDARGDMVLKWLESTGDLQPGGSLHLDVLKLPHHGSDRNVSPEFFARLTAAHYVVSGNGGHGNPEPKMLEMLFTARPHLDYTVHLTYGPEELKKNNAFKKAGNGPKLDAVLADTARQAVLHFPAPGQGYLDVPL